ncbi:MAG: glycosyltransferase family 4 protein [Opitutales bacterium]|nr:glycosyltransferase family 4 protein [Opitutales bacterium]
MKILQLSITYTLSSDGLDSDLAEALAKNGHEVCVAAMSPKFESPKGTLADKNGVEVLCVKTGTIQKVSKYKKGLNFIMLPHIVKGAIKRHFGKRSFDLVLFEAPPVTLQSVVWWAKKYFRCPAYLMQKDIFPQNAVDLGFFKKNSLPYFYFRNQEKKMLKAADFIGCMSQANIDYIREKNPYINPERVEYFPNTKAVKAFCAEDKAEIRAKFGIPKDACVFLFGGNMGKPQNVEIINGAISHFSGDESVYFLFIGSGTEAGKIKNFIAQISAKNAKFLDYMPRADYERILKTCDVGIISLSPKFTFPNYPSKILSYMECGVPVAASLDRFTDCGKLIAEDAQCGLFSDASNPEGFYKIIKTFAESPELRRRMGLNGRKYLEENFDVSRSVKILEGRFGSSPRRI